MNWSPFLQSWIRYGLKIRRKQNVRRNFRPNKPSHRIRPMTSRKSKIPGYPDLVFADSPNDPRLPKPGEPEPPFVKSKPGALSFRLGPLNFRQLVYDGERNRNEPVVIRPGRLSFRLGPFIFRQIPTDQFRLYFNVFIYKTCIRKVKLENKTLRLVQIDITNIFELLISLSIFNPIRHVRHKIIDSLLLRV